MRFLLKTGILFPCLLGLLSGTVAAQPPARGIHQIMDRLVVVCVFGLLLFLAYLLRRVRPGGLAAG